MRVAINAQLPPASGVGGVETVLAALISALGRLTDGPEEYVIVGPSEGADWWQCHTGSNQRIVAAPGSGSAASRGLSSLPGRIARRAIRSFLKPRSSVPVSNGFFESLRCEVVHFPYQHFVKCAMPSIFNPHDLQHLHFPQFFTAADFEWRETVYRSGCRMATYVATASEWVKQDIVNQYAVPADNIQVIPWASPTLAIHPSADLAQVRRTYSLPHRFAFYPSMTWPHKNHTRLLEALALQRDRHGLRIPLVCSGHQTDFFPTIRETVMRLRLDDQVTFVGLVPGDVLAAIYQLAEFVIVPTLFEAASAPLFEAWQFDVPVASSTVTSLPEQAADAALLFDPESVEAISAALRRMALEPGLRESLRMAGRRRRDAFSWERTARAYRALYRRAAGRRLGEGDHALLNWNWMRTPQPLPEPVL